MSGEFYVIMTLAVAIIGIIGFVIVQSNHKKQQQFLFDQIKLRLLEVKTRDEFEDLYFQMVNKEIKGLTKEQHDELYEIKKILDKNLI
jgi:vacuolar-type H+-ATPase subunit I/STV1